MLYASHHCANKEKHDFILSIFAVIDGAYPLPNAKSNKGGTGEEGDATANESWTTIEYMYEYAHE